MPQDLEAASKTREVLEGIDQQLLHDYMDALFPIPTCSDIY
jgi:hypothetical protein